MTKSICEPWLPAWRLGSFSNVSFTFLYCTSFNTLCSSLSSSFYPIIACDIKTKAILALWRTSWLASYKYLASYTSSLSLSLKNRILLPSCFTILWRHMQILNLCKLERLFMFWSKRICSTFDSWQFYTRVSMHLSDTATIKWFGSAPFFMSTFMIGSRLGSITRFKLTNISSSVIKAILLRADLKESASFTRLPMRLWSWFPIYRIKLWWCLHTYLMTPQASNWTNQSLLKMPYPFAMAFLNSFSGFSRGSRSLVSVYIILLDYVSSAGSSPSVSPIMSLLLKLRLI